MADKIFVFVSFLAVVAFLGVVVMFVREVDLVIITLVALGISAIFLWQEIKPNNGNGGAGAPRGPQSDR